MLEAGHIQLHPASGTLNGVLLLEQSDLGTRRSHSTGHPSGVDPVGVQRPVYSTHLTAETKSHPEVPVGEDVEALVEAADVAQESGVRHDAGGATGHRIGSKGDG